MLLFPLKTTCEVVLMSHISKQNAVTLLICADRYHVDFLKQKCKQYIMDHYDEVPRHNSNRWQRSVDILLTGPVCNAQMLREQPEFEKELCKVPELLVELTRSALSREEPRRFVVLDTSMGSPSSGRGEKRRRGN